MVKRTKERNKELRAYIRSNNLHHYEVAEMLGMQDSNFSRILRKELPQEKKEEIMRLIDAAVEESKKGN